MEQWSRTTAFATNHEQEETWIYQGPPEQKYQVQVTLGKPVDILALQQNIVENFNSNLAQVKGSREAMFSRKDLEPVRSCPICQTPTKQAVEAFTVYHATYVACPNCHHHYLKNRPAKKVLDRFYATDTDYQSAYIDKKTTETRIKEVATPKARWVISQFERIYGRKPKAILDVGAGSGHFVHAARQLGVRTDGVELSKQGQDFSKKAFGINLISKDFLKTWKEFGDYEVITFWGLIEHIPEPMKMLAAASAVLAGRNGLVVATVPRWDSFSTAIQKISLQSIIRHLDPLGHLHCFTDSSLATAFQKNKLSPAAAWYFGMDAYELTVQTSHLINNNEVIRKLGKSIPNLQGALDLAKLSDEIALAGTTGAI